ncbi:MAG: tyrosine-type recombinase/integrase [Bacillota bacterium]
MKSSILDIGLYKQWLTDKKSLSESSIDLYVKSMDAFLRSNPDIDDIEIYNRYIIDKSIKKRMGYLYYTFKSFIEFKIEDTKLKREMLSNLLLPPVPEGIKVKRKHLDEDILIEILNNLEKPKHRVIALVQMLTGVRAGDIFKCKRDRIVPEEYKKEPVLRLELTGKRGKDNTVFIYDDIAQTLIVDYICNNFGYDTYYFIELGTMNGRKGNVHSEYRMYKMNYLWYWQDLKQALEKVGINKKDFATHDFRRCYARRVWTKYKDFEVLKNLLNHSSPETTFRYLKQSGLKNIDYHKEMQIQNEN